MPHGFKNHVDGREDDDRPDPSPSPYTPDYRASEPIAWVSDRSRVLTHAPTILSDGSREGDTPSVVTDFMYPPGDDAVQANIARLFAGSHRLLRVCEELVALWDAEGGHLLNRSGPRRHRFRLPTAQHRSPPMKIKYVSIDLAKSSLAIIEQANTIIAKPREDYRLAGNQVHREARP